MKLKNRFIIAIAAFVVLQGALCPALCVAFAGSGLTNQSDLDEAQNDDQASGSCHGHESGTIASERSDAGQLPDTGDPAPQGVRCGIDCGDDVPLLSDTSWPEPPHLADSLASAFQPSPPSAQSVRFAADEPEARPPPRPLYLLKNSFLI